MKRISRWLLSVALALAGCLQATAGNEAGAQGISIAGYFLTDRQGVTSSLTPLADLSGLSVSPESGIVYADEKWASQNENTFTLTVPFGYKVTHWVCDYTNFTYSAGTKIPDSDGKTFLVWNYDPDGGTFASLAPVLAYDDTRCVSIVKSPFGRGTVGTNEGTHVCLKGDAFHLKAVPTRNAETGFDHATFRRWSDGVTDYERSFVVDTNVSLVAEFIPNSWKVILNPGGGEVFPTSKVVTCDAAYGYLPTPVRTGYDFTGWYPAKSGGDACNPNTTVGAVGDHTLYARWDAQLFSIAGLVDKASSDYGTVTGGGSYAYDTTATLKANPEEGFRFAGWTDGVTTQTRRIHVISNASYTATFAMSYCAVTFGYYGDGDRWTNVVQSVAYGGAATPPPEGEASRHDGLPFQSWSSDEYKCAKRDLTITAQYEKTFDVRFVYRDRDGNCVTGAVQRVSPGESATPPPASVCDIWTGHSLVGWSPDYGTIRSDCFISAEYAIKTYDVVFCYCDARGKEQQHAEYVAHGERVPFEFANSVKNLWAGHTFIAWNVNGRDIVDDYLVASNDMQVVARYEGYAKISYNGGDGSQGEMAMQTFTNVVGDVQLRPNAFTKVGYTFESWAGSDGKDYKDGATVSVTDGFTLELTANWEPIQYTVTFDGNGGIGEHDPVKCRYGEETTITFSSESFYRDGHSWLGLGTNRTDLLYEKTQKQSEWKPVISNLTTQANAIVPLYAIWKVNSYDVVIDGVATNLPYGSKIEKPQDPVPREGYTFVGWTTNDVLIADSEWPISVPARNLKIESAWEEIPSYEVCFHANEGTGTMANQKFLYGEEKALSSVQFTAPRGMIFDVWTNGVDATTYADGQVVSNLTTEGTFDLHATWKSAPSYQIEFAGRGGLDQEGVEVYSQSVACGVETALLSNRFARAGYSFANWTNGVGEVYADGVKVTDLAEEDATASLGAAWTPIVYSIAFDGKDATDGEMAPMSNVVYDVATNLTKNAFAKTGYTFSKWWLDEESYDDRAVVSNLTTVANEEVVLTAQWTANRYTVRFNPNGGTGEMTSQTMTYDVTTNLTGNTYVSPSTWFVFGGWTNAVGRIFANGASVSNLTAEPDGTVDLYARWVEAATYWVHFDGNGATSGEMDDQRFRCGEGGTLNPNRYARTGCGFGGWTNAAGKAYADGCEIPTTQDLAPTGETAVLYAAWTNNAYVCTFIDDYAKKTTSMNYLYGETVTRPDPVRTGYASGWTTNGVPVALPFPMPARDLTLVATYTPITYAIAFDGNGADSGSMEGLTGIRYDTSVTLASNRFERMKYTFEGWTNSTGRTFADGQTVSNLTTTAGETVRMFAKWAKVENPLGEALGIPDLKVSVSAEGAWTSLGPDCGVTRTSTSPDGTLSIVVPCAGTLTGQFAQDKAPYQRITVTCDGESKEFARGEIELTPDSGQSIEFSGTPNSGRTWTLKDFVWTPSK